MGFILLKQWFIIIQIFITIRANFFMWINDLILLKNVLPWFHISIIIFEKLNLITFDRHQIFSKNEICFLPIPTFL